MRNEYVIYSAYWDHLGIDETLPGGRARQIYYGVLDNASGVPTMLEIARAYKALPVVPKRTILFLVTTSEEQGLLGAQYYAQHPLYRLAKTLGDINIADAGTQSAYTASNRPLVYHAKQDFGAAP